MKKSIGLLWIVLGCYGVIACTDENSGKKNLLAGQWVWVKNYGGFTGHIEHTPKSTGHELTYVFDKKFGCIQIDNGDTIQLTSYEYAKDEFMLTGGTADILTIHEQFYVTGHYGQDSLIVVDHRSAFSFSGDSLILQDDQIDGYTWWYIKATGKK